MVNGQNGHFELNFVVKFQVPVDHFDHENFDLDYGHDQNFDYLTSNISRFRPWLCYPLWSKNDHGH